MTKAELVAKLAENTGITKNQADKVLNSLVEVMTDELKSSGGMALAGLGSFSVVRREARKGHNPKTKAVIDIPASNSVKFKSAKALKDSVN
ncbi:MAG: HU family DNA-binding protein [Candidatus Adiutrix sp.]|nr:HU family DNA-binding protein [Candidatus Adiutrix sp.]